METGNDVDMRARELFPGGVLVERGDAGNTARLVAERAGVKRHADSHGSSLLCQIQSRSMVPSTDFSSKGSSSGPTKLLTVAV